MPCFFRPGAPASYAGLELKEPSVKPDLTAEYLAATNLSGVSAGAKACAVCGSSYTRQNSMRSCEWGCSSRSAPGEVGLTLKQVQDLL